MIETTDTQWRDAVLQAMRKINAHKAADEAVELPALAVSYLCEAHASRADERNLQSHSTGGEES
jgi:hypothetical protein